MHLDVLQQVVDGRALGGQRRGLEDATQRDGGAVGIEERAAVDAARPAHDHPRRPFVRADVEAAFDGGRRQLDDSLHAGADLVRRQVGAQPGFLGQQRVDPVGGYERPLGLHLSGQPLVEDGAQRFVLGVDLGCAWLDFVLGELAGDVADQLLFFGQKVGYCDSL